MEQNGEYCEYHFIDIVNAAAEIGSEAVEIMSEFNSGEFIVHAFGEFWRLRIEKLDQ